MQYQAPLEKKICLSNNQNCTVIKIIEHGGKAISESRTQSQNNLVNEKIRSREVRLIDENGENLGVIETAKALQMAYDKDLDLVVISPNQNPPVAKILNYGKYKFEAEKKAKEAKKKQRVVEIKEIKLRYKIDTHDYNVRMKSIKKFLEEGNKVKVVVMLRGREMQHSHLAFELANRIVADLADFPHAVEKEPSLEGKNLLMIFAPTASN